MREGSCGELKDIGDVRAAPVEVDAGELPVDGSGPVPHGGLEGEDARGQFGERGGGRAEHLALEDREVDLDLVDGGQGAAPAMSLPRSCGPHVRMFTAAAGMGT